MPRIIMMYGLPASGKSTIAENIESNLTEEGLDIDIVKSVKTRDKESLNGFGAHSIDESLEKTKKEKDESYLRALKIARTYLNRGKIPLLDSTFHISRRRRWLYELADEKDSMIYAVWCVMEDEGRILRILDERKKSRRSDHILDSIDAYNLMRDQSEPITKEEAELYRLRILKIDWTQGKVECNFQKDPFFPIEDNVLENRIIYNTTETGNLL